MINFKEYLEINEATLTNKGNLNKGVYFNEDSISQIFKDHDYKGLMHTDTIFDIVYISNVHYKIKDGSILIDIIKSIRETSDPQLRRILYDTFQIQPERNVRSRYIKLKNNSNLFIINLLQDKINNGTVRRLPKELQTVLLRNSKTGQFLYLVSDTKSALDKISRYKLVKSEDWEKLLAIAWNFNEEEYQNTENRNQYYQMIANKSNVSVEFAKKFDPSNEELNRKYVLISDGITNQLKDIVMDYGHNPNEYVMRYARKLNIRPTSEWVEYGSTSTQPKTDIYLAKNMGIPIKISLKKKGGSQLLSASENEIKALFNCAFDYFESDETDIQRYDIDELFNSDLWSHFTLKNKNIREIKHQIDSIKSKLSPNWDTLSEIEKLQKIKSIEDEQVKDVMLSMINHKKLNSMVKDLIKDRGFKNFLIEEALTGYYKFGEHSLGSAEFLLVFDTINGGIVDKFTKINQQVVQEISNEVEFNISFKSYQKSADTTLRILYKDYVKKESVNYTIKEMLIESYQETLNEGFFGDIYDTFTSWLMKFFNKIKNFLISIYKRGLKEFMDLFGIDYDIEIVKNYTF